MKEFFLWPFFKTTFATPVYDPETNTWCAGEKTISAPNGEDLADLDLKRIESTAPRRWFLPLYQLWKPDEN